MRSQLRPAAPPSSRCLRHRQDVQRGRLAQRRSLAHVSEVVSASRTARLSQASTRGRAHTRSMRGHRRRDRPGGVSCLSGGPRRCMTPRQGRLASVLLNIVFIIGGTNIMPKGRSRLQGSFEFWSSWSLCSVPWARAPEEAGSCFDGRRVSRGRCACGALGLSSVPEPRALGWIHLFMDPGAA